MYNQVNISSGHSINCQGAADIINEVEEARKVVDRVYQIIKDSGKACYKYHDTSSDEDINLSNIVNWHNGFKDGIDVSLHFNASKKTTKPVGVEVWYLSAHDLAAAVSKNISKASGLIDRGAKTKSLYFLNHTNKPAILIEVCFVDSVKDVELYRNNFENICKAIAESLIGPLKKVDPIKIETPKVDAATSYKAKITASTLNVRIGPGTVYAIVTTVKKDDVYTIVEVKNNWGKLKSGAGWISLEYTKKL